ncbi:MAG TPA: GSCFA domain-containing protein [Spirochaetota bacterium]|nr:GSCFA domain-containing protein [Spirochaetota bacterium]
MKLFRSLVQLPDFNFTICHKDSIFSSGSCFSEEIANRLHVNGFQVLKNPSGILFNPVSIETSIERIIHNVQPDSLSEFHENNGIFYSLLNHSSVNAENINSLKNAIITNQKNSAEFIKNCSVLIITYGSSLCYKHIKSGITVGNCHKIPNTEFSKYFLSHNQIINSIINTISLIRETNSKVKIIFTVSPVIHNANGLVDNMRSKASLISAIYEAISEIDSVWYFPSFEIITQELRDYRFYKDDMSHPSDTAVDYVWDLFKNSLFSDESLFIAKECEKLYLNFLHKPFDSKSSEYKLFVEKTIQKQMSISQKLKRNIFEDEMKNFITV